MIAPRTAIVLAAGLAVAGPAKLASAQQPTVAPTVSAAPTAPPAPGPDPSAPAPPPPAAPPAASAPPVAPPAVSAPAAPPPAPAPAAAPKPATVAVPPTTVSARPRVTRTWDLNLDGGVGYSFGEHQLSGFGRVRGGILWVDETDIVSPTFRAVGLTYELSDLTPATFQLQVESMSLSSGVWIQLGAGADIQPRPAFMLALGFSILGAEAQLRWNKDDPDEKPYFALYGKLRIPVSIIAYALR